MAISGRTAPWRGLQSTKAIRGNQRHSDVISANQCQSEAIRGNQRQSERSRWQSVAISGGNERYSVAISGRTAPCGVVKRRQSEAIRDNQMPSDAIRCHQWQSVAIGGNQKQSKVISGRAAAPWRGQSSEAIRGNHWQSGVISGRAAPWQG